MAGKRGQNEGSIFQERPGRWVAQLTLGYEIVDGKRRRIRKKFTATTRKAVQQRLTAALRELQTGGTVPIQKDTLGAFLNGWLPTLANKGRKDSTIASYEWLIEKHIEPELGRIPLTKLTQRDINAFMQRKLAGGLSARTVRYCHAVLRSALTKAEKEGVVGRNVAKLAEPPGTGEQGQIEPLTIEQARTFLAAAAGHRLEALFSVAIAVGLRRGEALGLSWADIDLDRRRLRVCRTIQRIHHVRAMIEGGTKSRLTSEDPKTQASGRTVPLPTFAIEALKRHAERQNIEREFAGDRWKESGLVFTNLRGSAIEPRNALRHFHGLLQTVKIPKHRFHDRPTHGRQFTAGPRRHSS